jgi:hypothetical protein
LHDSIFITEPDIEIPNPEIKNLAEIAQVLENVVNDPFTASGAFAAYIIKEVTTGHSTQHVSDTAPLEVH